MNRRTPNLGFPHAARGAVLFVALVFLILITLLGLTAAGTSVMEERMTGGMRSNQMSLLGAETAARGAESWLWNLANNSQTLNCGFNGGDQSVCYHSQIQAGGSTGGYLLTNPKVLAFRTTPTWIPLAGSGATTYGTVGYGTTMTGLSGSMKSASLSKQPQWIMEDMGLLLPDGAMPNGEGGSQTRYSDPSRAPGSQQMHSYRITARSTGGNDGSVHAVETYFSSGIPSN